MWRTVVLAVLLVLPACSDPVSAESDILHAEISGARLALMNRTNEPVYYFAVDSETATVIDWGPCTDPPQCESVPSRSTRRIAIADLHIRDGASSLIIYHWRLVPAASQSGYVFDSVRTVTLELR